MTNRLVVAAVAALMLGSAAAGVALRPTVKLSDEGPAVKLDTMIPTQFGDWHEERQAVRVVDPQTQEMLDRLYSQLLTRTYANSQGYRVMLSMAYGSDQRGSLQAHKPEVCYPAQGFTLLANDAATLTTPYGSIPVRRLHTRLQDRWEPVTYWFTIGEHSVQTKFQKRVVEVLYGLTGRIPDGLLFRVSSLDEDKQRAYQAQDQFVNDLLASLAPAARKRLSGLDAGSGQAAVAN